MWPFYLLGLLVACLVGWLATWLVQAQRIRQLERSNEEIQVEETLVFDFLHGLGAAFTETIRPADLHRLIVEGAARILDALKTERAQADVDQRRTVAAFAEAIEAPTFGEERAKEGGEQRVESAKRLRDAVVKALGEIHKLLEDDQRKRFARR